MGQRIVYIDHAATTFMKPDVLAEMFPSFTGRFWNPSSVSSLARESKQAVEAARRVTDLER
jgi:cysteine desulfurase